MTTDVAQLLADADLTPRGFLANASNHTLLVQVGPRELGLHAVYKPQAGERPLWDFPPGTLWLREAAAFIVSEFLGWGLVPPTVARQDAPMGPGSLQEFIPHDPQRHYYMLVDDPATHPTLARLALFDLLINNADRKASHVMEADDGRILGCDHGLAFNIEPKLRTVIWELGGTDLEPSARADLGRLARALEVGGELRPVLAELLLDEEIDALRQRAAVLRGLRSLPDVEVDRRPYPWPPL